MDRHGTTGAAFRGRTDNTGGISQEQGCDERHVSSGTVDCLSGDGAPLYDDQLRIDEDVPAAPFGSFHGCADLALVDETNAVDGMDLDIATVIAKLSITDGYYGRLGRS